MTREKVRGDSSMNISSAQQNCTSKRIVVIGNGMVGHHFITKLIERARTCEFSPWHITTFCEEPRVAYDRVGLSTFFEDATEESLSLADHDIYTSNLLDIHVGDAVIGVDTDNKTVTSAQGREISYDTLVLATGSYPFVPPIPGKEAAGTFVYRTIEDLKAIRDWAGHPEITKGAVIGGGLLGLEAAKALKSLGLDTHVVEFAPRLMPVQVDESGGLTLRSRIEELGVTIHTGTATEEITSISGLPVAAVPSENNGGPDACAEHKRIAAMRFASGEELEVDIIVFSAGIRPRDELARSCGLSIGERGGIVVDDSLHTSASEVYAIGECALYDGRIYGLVAPGYRMAEAVVEQLAEKAGLAHPDAQRSFTGADMSTKLKLMGVDVASFGDAHEKIPGAQSIVFEDPIARTYRKLVLDETGKKVLGGILVGDASPYDTLHQYMVNNIPVVSHPERLLLPDSGGIGTGLTVASLPGSAVICSCHNVDKSTLCSSIRMEKNHQITDLKNATKAGTGCGSCVTLLNQILKDELTKAGIEVSHALCEHFSQSRQELFSLVRMEQLSSWSEIISRFGTGKGCEICKPTVASMLASLANGYILDGEQATLQDTNDHFLANIQKNGTYSVVPRIPGGELTPEQLIAIGEVAKDFDLYLKITGAQRIDLFGAHVEQLPLIWERLIDVGLESGHAYGKALRTVKSCVGSTWCRYGQGDSVSLAIELELRYRGLRSPHKLKSAVSGCARECAEAQGKDFGIIATEKGWNLYLAGNGGMRPQHGVLFAEDLDKETLIKYIDRYLMFYIHTADKLQRTASWFNELEGGVEYLREVVIDDSLGICAELEADMARHIENYACEWKATIEDPQRMARFIHFVNAPGEPDPHVVFIRERNQKRPASHEEKTELQKANAVAGVQSQS